MRVKENLIASPLNYIGGKYKLLPQILPLFPDEVNVFVDLFCGGCNVGVNASARKVVCNDSDSQLIGLFTFLQKNDYEAVKQKVDNIIAEYRLSDSSKNHYSFYGCDSSRGLGKYNGGKFLKLRDDFNALSKTDEDYYLYLYVLIVYAFNNQIRFNSKGEFNLPVGKRDFNGKMQKKLKAFMEAISGIAFTNKSFDSINSSRLSDGDFVYADPPYLITCATYNEKNGWNETQEKSLLSFLDSLSERNIKFALSNVVTSNGKANEILISWLSSNKGYHCHHLQFDYKNSNYHRKKTEEKTDEVLITNY